MNIPFRKTIPTNIGEYIINEYNESAASPLIFAEVSAECAKVQALRSKIETDTPSLSNLREYYNAISEVSNKTALANSVFTWQNSLTSQSLFTYHGLHFEKINVMFNIACALTRSKGQLSKLQLDWKQASWWFTKIGAMLNDPQWLQSDFELNPRVLRYLADICMLHSQTFTAGGNENWHTAAKLEALAKQSPELGLVCVNHDWIPFIIETARRLRISALLQASTQLHRSRKKTDQINERALLLMCLELDPENQEAHKMINEPLGRKDKSSLKDLRTSAEFSEADFFPSGELPEMPALDESQFGYDAVEPNVFCNIPSVWSVNAVFMLQVKLRSYIQDSVVKPLNESSETLRYALAKTGIPVVMEFSHSPNNIPDTLLANSDRCVPDFTGLKFKGTPLLDEMLKLESKYRSIESLLALQETEIAELIGINVKPKKKRTTPLVLERAYDLTNAANELISECESETLSVLFDVKSVDFLPMLQETPSKELNSVLKSAASQFDSAVNSAKLKLSKATQLARRLEESHNKFASSLLDKKATKAQLIYTATLIESHTAHRLKLMKLDADEFWRIDAATRKGAKEVKTPPLNGFHWEPGYNISFGPPSR